MVIIILQCCGVHFSPLYYVHSVSILLVSGGSVSLKDMDGKEYVAALYCIVLALFPLHSRYYAALVRELAIYKQSELSALSDGSTLVVGGKELEVL